MPTDRLYRSTIYDNVFNKSNENKSVRHCMSVFPTVVYGQHVGMIFTCLNDKDGLIWEDAYKFGKSVNFEDIEEKNFSAFTATYTITNNGSSKARINDMRVYGHCYDYDTNGKFTSKIDQIFVVGFGSENPLEIEAGGVAQITVTVSKDFSTL